MTFDLRLGAICLPILFAASSFAQAERLERPIRGVWLRPPVSLATLESNLESLAEAGIQDLFLETFYHGLATNDSDVFADRFGFDYLGEATRLAARHGVRVHAWLETGYWSFGSSGQYLFDANPDWRVESISGSGMRGDIAGQTFANLAHPGVQEMLGRYVRELADADGLWGIHIDYHRYPVDDAAGDQFPAPYTYDAWTRAAFMADDGRDPLTAAATPAGPAWGSFVAWRRAGVSHAVGVMHDGIHAVNPGIEFSAAIFASAMSSPAQLSKMQDWPTWAARGDIEHVIPMAYGSSAGSIRSDLALARSLASGRRVIAGLAITGSSPHPSISVQLHAALAEGIEDFVFFEGNTLINSDSRLTELRSWLAANATLQRGDLNADGHVDGRDLQLFSLVFTGSPVGVDPRNRRYDLNADGVIDAGDAAALEAVFVRNRFGEDGVVDVRDVRAAVAAFTGPGDAPAPPLGAPVNLYDLDADGDVDGIDLAGVRIRTACPCDWNLDGGVSSQDFFSFLAGLFALNADYDGSGATDSTDFFSFLSCFFGGC